MEMLCYSFHQPKTKKMQQFKYDVCMPNVYRVYAECMLRV